MGDDEAAFQAKLDDAPNDHTARLVFADWLQERDDPRADGYRALARCGFVLCDRTSGTNPKYLPHRTSRVFKEVATSPAPNAAYALPADWYEALAEKRETDTAGCVTFKSRREAEDATANAFAQLPSERKAELLAGVRGGLTKSEVAKKIS